MNGSRGRNLLGGGVVGLALLLAGCTAGSAGSAAPATVISVSSVVTTAVSSIISTTVAVSPAPSAPPSTTVTATVSGSGSAPTAPPSTTTVTRTTSSSRVQHLSTFRMPSGNIGCTFDSDADGPLVSCVIGTVDAGFQAEPGDAPPCGSVKAWTHRIVFHRQKFDYPCGAAAPVPDGPVLSYGQVNSGGLLFCRSAETGLICASPVDETGFTLSSQRLQAEPGEGGGSVVQFAADGTHALVAAPGERTWFQSHDRSVSCAVVVNSVDAHAYCVPTTGSFPRPADALGCAGGGDPIAVLNVFAQHSASAVACGGRLGDYGVNGSRSDQVKAATFPAGGVVVAGGLTCTIGSTSVSCTGADGIGFGLNQATYRPLPS